MNCTQIENIKNEKLKEFAKSCQSKSKGDFDMIIIGGVNLEEFAAMIIKENATTLDTWGDSGKYSTFGERLKAHWNLQ